MVYATTGYTIATNGQTLIIAAPTVGGATATVYTTAACTAAHTFPQVITTDTTYYVDPTATPGRYLVSAKQLDGTELWGGKVDCFRGDGVVTISPLPTQAQVASDASRTIGRFVSGYYYLAGYGPSSTTGAATVNTLTAFPFVVPNACSITKIGSEVTGAGGSGSVVRIGLYADDGTGYPGALVVDAGTIDGTSATVQDITLGSSVELTAGVYWSATVAQVGTAPTLRVWNIPSLMSIPMRLGTSTPGAGALGIGYGQGSVTGALPATFSTSISAQSSIPRVHLKVA